MQAFIPRFLSLALALFLISLFGCNSKHEENEDFDIFFEHFISEKEFELSRTNFPLSSYRHEYGIDENGSEETAVIETTVSKETLARQPTQGSYIKKHGLSFNLKKTGSSRNKKIVKIFKPGTDWLIEYHFECKSENWILVSTYDYSL